MLKYCMHDPIPFPHQPFPPHRCLGPVCAEDIGSWEGCNESEPWQHKASKQVTGLEAHVAVNLSTALGWPRDVLSK